jgi:hypothetical protein
MSLALLWVVMSFQQVSAGGLNLPAGSNGGRICKVTSMVDDVKVVGSLRRAMVSGYNVQDSALPSFCTEKIVFDAPGTITLRDSIELNNKAASGFTLEKATGVTGEVILDATGVGDGKCAIVVDSNQVTIRGISIRNASGPGICIKSGSNQNLLENVRVANSADGVLVESGSIDNVIQQGEFFNNRGFGVNLQGAEQNLVTKNSIHGNGAGPISSPAGDLRPTIASAAPSNSAATTWVLSGSVPTSVHHIEVYRGVPSVNNTTYITDILELSGLSFVATIEASSGEQIWAIGIGADNTTSPSSEITTLSVVGGVGGNPGSGPRACFPGQVFTPTQDFDRDGIFDVNEDKNANCNVDTGETDPEKDDTDGDTISDGLEDFNKNGVIDDGESDPANTDTDGDGLEDNIEDRLQDGRRTANEFDPADADTDDDGIPDNFEDIDGDGEYDRDIETNGFKNGGLDTDRDGLEDGEEDLDLNGVHDPIRESDPRVRDTDGDNLLDANDNCPNNPSTSCTTPCIPGVEPDESIDNDNDRVPDIFEDLDSNCEKNVGETDPFDKDSDDDGRNDNIDACPDNPDPTCEGVCDPENINPFLDSDSDGLTNLEEDINGNCIVDPLESDPLDPDTDDDNVTDGNDTCRLDPNPLCDRPCQPGIVTAEGQDSDGDSIPDSAEDIDRSCTKQERETDFRKRDTDGDGLNDNRDSCPNDPDANCVKECFPGEEFTAPQRDSDRDGVFDVLEDTNHDCTRSIDETDAFAEDTDGDGIQDGVEDKNRSGILDSGETDPRNPDTDGDGIIDGVEDKNQNGIFGEFDECNPLLADTDEDGIFDFNEDISKNGILDAGETNCARKDTDQDGLDDGLEDINKNGVVDAGETDPRNPDTDGDGATDGQEVSFGTNPIHASSGDLNRAIGQGCALGAGGNSTGRGFMIGLITLFLGLSVFRVVNLSLASRR